MPDVIDDISTRLEVTFYEDDAMYDDDMSYHRMFYKGYSDNLATPLNEGGKFLEIKYEDEETYNELLKSAKPIPDKQYKYEIEFGYFPYEKNYKSKQEINQIMKNGIMTGRAYRLCSGKFLEIEYEGERIIYDYEHKQAYSVKPIKWIIYTKNHRIISESPIADPFYYKEDNIDYTIKNQIDNNSVHSEIINIDNGVLTNLIINYSNIIDYRYINLPSFVTEIRVNKNDTFPSENYGLSYYSNALNVIQNYIDYKTKITLPRSIERFNVTSGSGETTARTIEVYDNIRFNSTVRGVVKFIIHYESFDSLLAFLDYNMNEMRIGDCCKGKIYLYGKERLTPEQSEIIRKYINYKWKKEPEESVTIAFNLPEIIVETPTEKKVEKEEPEENKISMILNKLYTYLAYYDNGEEKINEIKQKIINYNQKINDLENKFYSGIDTLETPDEVYNTLLYELELELSKVKDALPYFKTIDLINNCLKALNDLKSESGEELVNDLYKLGNIVLPHLKENYHKYYKETIINLLNIEKKKIADYINNRLKNLEYNTPKDFEIYFRNILHPLLGEINIAINDENIKRNFSKEIMDVTKNLMESKFTEASQNNKIRNLEYLKETSINLDKKIEKSPFAKDFQKDKEKILSYAIDIDKYFNDSNLKEKILSSCQTLKKYVKRKAPEFEQIDKLIEEIIKDDKINGKGMLLFNQIINMQNEKSTYKEVAEEPADNTIESFDINNSETKKIESALYQIITVLGILDLEVTGSIEKQKSFERCKIRL